MSMRTWTRLMCVVAAFGLTLSLAGCKKEEPKPTPKPPVQTPAQDPVGTPAP